MTADQSKTVRVVVKLRDLDTDARTVFEHDVAVPEDQAQRRTRLVEAVAEHKPEAELRSFAGHAASFLDDEHLVVAYFEEPREIGRTLKEMGDRGDQPVLFAALEEEAA